MEDYEEEGYLSLG